MREIELNIYGPLSWFSSNDENIFNSLKSQEHGIYLWTVPHNEGYLVYYVGETGRTFKERMIQHTQEYVSGNYSIRNVDKLKIGINERIWEGVWRYKEPLKYLEFIERRNELLPVLVKQLNLFKIFFIPCKSSRRNRTRIERAIAMGLYENPDPLISDFQDRDIQYRGKRNDKEEELEVLIFSSHLIHGLQAKFIC